MPSYTEEHKHEEHKIEEHKVKEKFDFMKWLKGKNKVEYVENISYVTILISALLISIGLSLGSFVYGVVAVAIVGALFVIIGIIVL